MCGIVGCVYGPDGAEAETWTPTEMLQLMLPASVHRGRDAWGTMSYSGEDTIDIFKMAGRADTQDAIAAMNIDPAAKWWVGHVRWFTNGSPTEMTNNHPIEHGNIIGVHNGVIHNHKNILNVTGRENDITEVDSEAIFAAINKWGHLRGLNRIVGDMVAVYVDVRYPETLRIARSHGRPLVVAWTPAGSMVFASEPKIIDALHIDTGDYSNVMEHRLLSVKRGKITKRQDLDRPPSPVVSSWHRPHYQAKMAPDRPRTVQERRALDTLGDGRYKMGDAAERALQRIIARGGDLAEAAERVVSATARPSRPSGKVMRTPEQNVKVQANGYMTDDGLYWLDGMLVDLDTWVDYKLKGDR